MSTTGPLTGMTVLDLSRQLPGQYCSMFLGDLGAGVLTVASPGDPQGIGIHSVARNKKSMTLNLRAEHGYEIFLRLVRKTDVLIEGFRPGVADRLKIDYESLRVINPRIVYCSISAYGRKGPRSDQVGYDINCVGMAGVLSLMSPSPDSPVLSNIYLADTTSAVLAAMAINAALLQRERGGEGQFIDVAMLDAAMIYLAYPCELHFRYDLDMDAVSQTVSGESPGYNVYRTKDEKWLSISAYEGRFWQSLCTVLDREDLKDQQYATGKERDKITEAFAEIFRGKDRDEWLSLLTASGVPCGPITSYIETFEDPHVQHRGMFRQQVIADNGEEISNQLGFPVRFSRSLSSVRSAPPTFGEHTEQVLLDLGFNAAEIDRFRKEGVI